MFNFARVHRFEVQLPLKINKLLFGEAIASPRDVTKKEQAQETTIDPRFLRNEFSPSRHIFF
jgi:hypothetical protein